MSVGEIMVMDDQIRRFVMKSPDATIIRDYLLNEVGMVTLQQDALYKVAAGITSVEEMLRVTG